MSDYSKSKIYKLISPHTNEVYYGSTKVSLSNRKSQHKTSFKKYQLTGKGYYTSFKLFELGDVEIILVEECKDIENREQLLRRERFFIENNDCINKNIPIQTIEEKKEKEVITSAIYREKNKEVIKEKYEINKEKYQENHKKRRQTPEEKEKIKEYNKKYREKRQKKI
jgi:hypothetical protein